MSNTLSFFLSLQDSPLCNVMPGCMLQALVKRVVMVPGLTWCRVLLQVFTPALRPAIRADTAVPHCQALKRRRADQHPCTAAAPGSPATARAHSSWAQGVSGKGPKC